MPYPGSTNFPGATSWPGMATTSTGPFSWLDPLSPANRSAVVSGGWGKLPHTDHAFPVPVDDSIDVISDALAAASDILSTLTGHAIHPALQVTEEFLCYGRTRSLRPSFQPIRAVAELVVVDADVTVNDPAGVVVHGGSIRFTANESPADAGWYFPLGLDFAHWYSRWMLCTPAAVERVTLVYNVGSTITASARRAVIALAHELYLQVSPCDECGECRLPSRTTNVTREGLSYNVSDPLDPLSTGGTGLPEVDLWVRGVNPRQATRRSGVYDPLSPPGVVRAVSSARAGFSAVVTGS